MKVLLCFLKLERPTIIFFDREKFAELIVRECAEICLDMAAKCAGVNDGALAKDCAYWIKKDFGIEE